jgi:hypothetical protein
MKKILLSLFAAALSVATVFAQAPEKMNDQGVARDISGNVLPNQSVGLQIKLRSGSSGGAVVYQEAHTASTNAGSRRWRISRFAPEERPNSTGQRAS